MITIERATADDCDAIAEAHVASWQAAYADIVSGDYLASLSVRQRATSWARQIAEGAPEVLVARDGSLVAGFIAFDGCRDPDAQPSWGEVWALYVLPSHWKLGVGRALWLAARAALAAQGFSRTTLWVLSLNARGIQFYTSVGFAPEPSTEKLFRLGGQELQEVRLVNDHVV